MNTSKLNCYKVVKGYSFYSLLAFCSLRAMNLHVYDVTAVKPVPIDSNQDYQSKFLIGVKFAPNAKMIISEETPIDRFR